jgi:hypothetical protein
MLVHAFEKKASPCSAVNGRVVNGPNHSLGSRRIESKSI